MSSLKRHLPRGVLIAVLVSTSLAFTLYWWTTVRPHNLDARQRAREYVLRENLLRMREIIDQYQSDKGKYPKTLQTLVTEGYLGRMPVDPITGSDSTWQVVYEDMETKPDRTAPPGVYDVHSGAQGYTLEGKPYSEL